MSQRPTNRVWLLKKCRKRTVADLAQLILREVREKGVVLGVEDNMIGWQAQPRSSCMAQGGWRDAKTDAKGKKRGVVRCYKCGETRHISIECGKREVHMAKTTLEVNGNEEFDANEEKRGSYL